VRATEKPAPTVGLPPEAFPRPTGGLEVDIVLLMMVLIAPVVFLAVIMLLGWVEKVVPGVPPDEVP
jgi:hypothetical protein